MAKILLVEDDDGLAKTVVDWLQAERHMLEWVSEGLEAASRMKNYQYDLIIMDWQLPDDSGVSLIKNFRSTGGQTPVIMMTGKRLIDEKGEGFEAGADDYLTKPFHMQELSMRIKALLRRPSWYTGNEIKAGALILNSASHTLLKQGKSITLLPREFALLEFLMRHPGKFFTAEALLERLWPQDSTPTEQALRQCVSRLRSKIDDKDMPSLIVSVHGLGYKFEAQ